MSACGRACFAALIGMLWHFDQGALEGQAARCLLHWCCPPANSRDRYGVPEVDQDGMVFGLTGQHGLLVHQ